MEGSNKDKVMLFLGCFMVAAHARLSQPKADDNSTQEIIEHADADARALYAYCETKIAHAEELDNKAAKAKK